MKIIQIIASVGYDSHAAFPIVLGLGDDNNVYAWNGDGTWKLWSE